MNPQLHIPKQHLDSFCRTHGITWLAVFGSALRDDFKPDSDIDLLVEFAPDRIPGLLRLTGMELEVSGLFGGRKTDLRTSMDLSRYIRQSVLDGAQTLYTQE